MKTSQTISPESIVSQWALYFNDGNLEGVLSMYHKDSTLFPTFVPRLLSSPEEIKGYFKIAIKGKASVEIDINESIKKELPGNIYLVTGTYVFTLKNKEGDKKYISWYSFLIDLSEDSPIQHHHSSRVPFEFDLSQISPQ
jgi:hypothetical protein